MKVKSRIARPIKDYKVLVYEGNTQRHMKLQDIPLNDEGLTFGNVLDMFLDMRDVSSNQEFGLAVQYASDGKTIKKVIPIHKIIDKQPVPNNVGNGYYTLDENNTIAVDEEKIALERVKV